jgi:RNA polymerase sigma factor (sigma-70 family)
MYPEEELVNRLKVKDQAAFTYLYNSYAPALFNIIRRVVKDQCKAEDMVQEVFCKIWHHIDSYDATKGRLFTWLVSVTKNMAIDCTRNRRYKEEQRTFLFQDADGGSYCLDQYHEVKDLRKLVSTLPYQHRNIMELTYFYGYTNKQVARLLQLPLGTVKTRLRSATRRLRVEVADKVQSCV